MRKTLQTKTDLKSVIVCPKCERILGFGEQNFF